MIIFFIKFIFILFFILNIILSFNLINSFNNLTLINDDKELNSKILIECKDPLIKWECKINKKEEEEEYLNITKLKEEEKENKLLKINSIPLEFYYSIKINRLNGQLFISAILRSEFVFNEFFNLYKIFLYIEEINNNFNKSSLNKENIFSITAISSSSSFYFKNSSSINNLQKRLELIIQLDEFFKFEYSYKIKIISLPKLKKELNNEFNIKQIITTSDKQINFDELPEEFDSDICHLTENNQNLVLWQKRQKLASRWTGAFRSIIFYPLHSAINISFYGAPPSFCINNYKIQLWLLNSLLQEKIINLSSLVREDKLVFIGFVEFRNLLNNDPILKYKIILIPIEKKENDEKCICELNNKCNCVQVISDWFTMPNISSISFNSSTNNLINNINLLNNNNTQIIKKEEEEGLLLIILIYLFISLTFIILTFALLLFIKNKFNCFTTKKQKFIIIRKKPSKDVLLPSKTCVDNTSINNNCGGAVYSILLANAQPSKSGDLERFARLLVKNGIRIFYDRWDKNAIERNLLFWVHQAITKADKAVFFWDKRAEQLLTPLNKEESKTINNLTSSSTTTIDIFDRVFCALHQQMNPEKTIFVVWDDFDYNLKPFGCIGENKPFIFSRDLSLIYTALKVPASEADIHKFARLTPIPSTTPSLTVFVPTNKKQIKDNKNIINKEQLLLTNNENEIKENLNNYQPINNEQTINNNKLEEERLLSAFDSGIDSSGIIAL